MESVDDLLLASAIESTIEEEIKEVVSIETKLSKKQRSHDRKRKALQDGNSTLNSSDISGILKSALRSYQSEILSAAKCRNTIAFLPTGSGKTLIAVHLILHRYQELLAVCKCIIVLAPTRILVDQQSSYLREQLSHFGKDVFLP